MSGISICLSLTVYDNDNQTEQDFSGNYSREYAVFKLKEAIQYIEKLTTITQNKVGE